MSYLLAFLLVAAGFSDPNIPHGERVVYLGYDGENNTSREVSHEVYREGDTYHSIHTHLDTTRIIVSCRVRASDLATLRVRKDRSGRLQLRIEPYAGGILVTDGFANNRETRVSHTGRFYDRHTLIEVFRGFPFDDPQPVEFPFFESNLGVVITGTCTYHGIHTISTPAGDFRCYKLTLGFKSQIVQTLYSVVLAGRSFDFYYETAESHRMIYWTDNKDGYMKLIRIERDSL